jgi:hypothetical protein
MTSSRPPSSVPQSEREPDAAPEPAPVPATAIQPAVPAGWPSPGTAYHRLGPVAGRGRWWAAATAVAGVLVLVAGVIALSLVIDRLALSGGGDLALSEQPSAPASSRATPGPLRSKVAAGTSSISTYVDRAAVRPVARCRCGGGDQALLSSLGMPEPRLRSEVDQVVTLWWSVTAPRCSRAV